jgi:branched-chain amino acid transport system substrate-binding protein
LTRFLTRCFAFFCAAVWVGSSPANAADPVEINVMVSQTGSLAFYGGKQAEAFRAIEMYANANGGVGGRPVKFVLHDDQSNPQTAVQLANQLIEQKVPVIVGPVLTSACAAIMPLLAQNGPVDLCYSPVITPPARGYVFRAAPRIEDVQSVMLRYFKNRGLKKLAIITATDASGQTFDQKLDVTLTHKEFQDLAIVAHEHFSPGDLGVAAQVARIKAAQPGAIITFAVGTSFGTVLHAISDSGLDVPVYGSGANLSELQMQSYAAFMPKELILNNAQGLVEYPGAPAAEKLQQAAFFKAMKAAGLRGEPPQQIAWDFAILAIDALRDLGPKATAMQIRDYILHQRSWAGLQGIYNFTSGDQTGLGESGVALLRWNPSKNTWELAASGAQ